MMTVRFTQSSIRTHELNSRHRRAAIAVFAVLAQVILHAGERFNRTGIA